MGISADAAVVNENLILALSAFSKVKPTGSVGRAPGLRLVRSGVNYGLFNTAVLSSPAVTEGEFEERIHGAGQIFAEHGVSWSLWYCEDLLEGTTRRRARIIQASNGLHITMEAPGMLAERLLPPARRLPVVECRRVGDEKTRRDFSLLMSLAFYMPMDLATTVYGSEGVWDTPMTGWVAYSGGKAVSTAVTYTGAGVVGVYAVGTDPKQQRKGYGEAVMRHALGEARKEHGIERTILQSSPAGLGLYLRMGYRQTTRFCVSLKSGQ